MKILYDLFSLALESKRKEESLYPAKDIVLGVGLPPVDFGQQAPGFKNALWFIQNMEFLSDSMESR